MTKYFAFIISIMLFCSCAQKQTEFAYKQTESGQFCIPVEINGKEKLFLFDTGCQGTIINYPVMKECGIQLEDSLFQTTYTVSDSTSGMTYYSNIRLSIGGIPFISTAVADRYNRVMLKNVNYNDFDAILGIEDIQKFNWLFNFEKKIVILSKDSITLPLLSDDQILNLDFSKNKKDITFIDLILNDSIKQTFLFDTGYFSTIYADTKKKQNIELNGDFILTPSLKEYINTRIPCCISIADNVLLIDSLKINNFQSSHLSSQRHGKVVLEENIITNNFLRRFRLMYYDSTNRKISLYVSPKDTNVYRGENEKKIIDVFISAILKQVKGNVREKTIVPIDPDI